MPKPVTLRRIAKWAFIVPAAVAVLGFLLPYVIPDCNPQLYGIGHCYLGSLNLAAPIVLAIFGGLYGAAAVLMFVVAPLLVLAWWLESRGRRDAV